MQVDTKTPVHQAAQSESPGWQRLVRAGQDLLRYAPHISRELLAFRDLPREPELDLVMEDGEHVAAYAAAGRVENTTLASYLFHTAHCTETIAGARRVVDLGCGPAIQLLQIAALNPDAEFIGVDLSTEMLDVARQELSRAGLTNVSLRRADITDLSFLDDDSVDGVVSTMTLHHLPTADDLTRCFLEIRRVLTPPGAIYLTDFCRLRSNRSVHFFSHLNEHDLPAAVILDAERSMRAAFTRRDYARRMRLLSTSVRLRSTFLVPLLMIMHTPRRVLSGDVRRRLAAMRSELSPRICGALDDLRSFFRMGGLHSNPFSWDN